jgi:hypothetical protein
LGNGNAGVLALLLIYFIKIVLWPNALAATVHMKVLSPCHSGHTHGATSGALNSSVVLKSVTCGTKDLL